MAEVSLAKSVDLCSGFKIVYIVVIKMLITKNNLVSDNCIRLLVHV